MSQNIKKINNFYAGQQFHVRVLYSWQHPSPDLRSLPILLIYLIICYYV